MAQGPTVEFGDVFVVRETETALLCRIGDNSTREREAAQRLGPANSLSAMYLPRHRRRGRADRTLLPLTTTCCISRVAGAFLLFVLLTSPRGSASDQGAGAVEHGPGSASGALTVSVSETPDAVLLYIRASGDIEPGSVEVRFAGRKAVVLARDAEARAIRSKPLRLPEPVVEEGSSADDYVDGALVVTLPKQATAQDAGPTGVP